MSAAAEPQVAGADLPIGVFDSGLGGLTVAREILRQLPDESIIYFGDTARVPYGPKSPETVARYAVEITDWLMQQGVKAVVVACNTATAHALPLLAATLPVPVLGVVEPGARAAVQAARGAVGPGARPDAVAANEAVESGTHGVVGVIGTAGTIASGAYERAIAAFDPDVRVLVRACPLFVPLVEEGWIDHPVTRAVAVEYLTPLVQAGMGALVLGCTHYPLLSGVLAEVAGPSTTLVDSAERTAASLRESLYLLGLRAPSGPVVRHRFVASDAPDQMLALGRRFLGAPVESVERVPLG